MKALFGYFTVWLLAALWLYVIQWDSLADWLSRDGVTLFWWSGPIALVAIIVSFIPNEEESK